MRGEGTYRRVPGKGRSLVSWYTLWLGSDHLLAVHTSGYHESYRRFYFRDIRGVATCRTGRGRDWSIALGFILALIAAAALLSGPGWGRNAWLVLSVPLVISLAVNLLLGPTCVCSLLMPLEGYVLPSVTRMRNARRLLEELRPVIRRVQGEVSAAELEELPVTPPPARERSVPRQPVPSTPSSPVAAYSGLPHRVLFALLLGDAILTPFELLYTTTVLQGLNILVILCQFILVITSLVKQSDHLVPKVARSLTWVALVNLIAGLMAVAFYSAIYTFTEAVAAGKAGRGAPPPAIVPLDHPFIVGVAAVSAVVSVVIGVAGLSAMLREVPPGGYPAVARPAPTRRRGAP